MNKYLPIFGLVCLLCCGNSLFAQNNTLPPEFTEKGKSTKVSIRPFKRVVYFGIDEIELDGRAKGILDKLYAYLAPHESLHVEITGHSNGSCDTEFCEEIANQRAETVALYLFEKGLSPTRLQYNGLGKKRPIANNRTEEGRKKNQRVEIRVFTNR